MASLDRADPVILGHLLQEHRELHSLLRQTRQAVHDESLQRSGAAAPSAVDADEAGERVFTALRCLREHLAVHFRQEECGGFLEESLTKLPRLADDVREVLSEHPRLLSEIDGLIERVSRGDIPVAGWTSLCRDVDAFVTRLVEHERRESRVVQQGYNEDLGLFDD
jgi:hypothetical protein